MYTVIYSIASILSLVFIHLAFLHSVVEVLSAEKSLMHHILLKKKPEAF